MKKTLLIVSANPSNAKRLRFDKEIDQIQKAIDMTNIQNFTIYVKLATCVHELQSIFAKYKPQIVHFSGHGQANGLLFENRQDKSQLVHRDALSNLFNLCNHFVECVVLNVCSSDIQAKIIHKHIKYVIGMKDRISDKAAILFSSGFYTGLCLTNSYHQAFNFGCNAIEIQGIHEASTPLLLANTSIDINEENIENNLKIEGPLEPKETVQTIIGNNNIVSINGNIFR